MKNALSFKREEAMPEVLRAIKRALRKHRRVSSSEILPYLRHTNESRRTPSDKVAWFGQRWTVHDPKYIHLFKQLRRGPDGPPWLYRLPEDRPRKAGQKNAAGSRGTGRRDESRNVKRLVKELAMAGFQQDPKLRKAIERYSMDAAKRYYRMKQFAVTDTSATEPYDLVCRSSTSKMFVEVKGTQMRGAKVMLTANEVEHLKAHRKDHVLFVLHSIEVRKHQELKGGVSRVVPGSKIWTKNLRLIVFEATLPG